MSKLDLHQLRDQFRDGLLEDTLPFWMKHGMRGGEGGVSTCLGRDGELLDSDKAVWPQGRFAWLLATLSSDFEARPEWLEATNSCLGFLDKHGFDENGRMYFLLTDQGQPLRKRRYAYSEAFACMAFAARAKCTGSSDDAQRAIQLFESYVAVSIDPGTCPAKVDPMTRPSKGIGPLMIGINLAQTLRDRIEFAVAQDYIDRWIDEIERDFCKPELSAVLESVAPDGALIDHFDGRMLNPGHAIEAAWFIMHEARVRGGDARLLSLGVRMLDWMWDRCWDREHGGIYYFRDLHDKPCPEYWHDMKFWWPHNEAIIATLLAHVMTGEQRHLERFQLVHEWAQQHFADPEHGEWFGYLHRDGTRSVDLKGNHWKGPFHVPRMQWYCWQLLEEHIDA